MPKDISEESSVVSGPEGEDKTWTIKTTRRTSTSAFDEISGQKDAKIYFEGQNPQTTFQDFFKMFDDSELIIDAYDSSITHDRKSWKKLSLYQAKEHLTQNKPLQSTDVQKPIICARIPANKISETGMRILADRRNHLAEYCQLQNEDQCFLSRYSIGQSGAESAWTLLKSHSVWISIESGTVEVQSTQTLTEEQQKAMENDMTTIDQPHIFGQGDSVVILDLKAGHGCYLSSGRAYRYVFMTDAIVLEGSF